jgi:hypothetical protein
MKRLVSTSLIVAIATTLGWQSLTIATPSHQAPEFSPSEEISQSYTHQRYRSGSGRREILS